MRDWKRASACSRGLDLHSSDYREKTFSVRDRRRADFVRCSSLAKLSRSCNSFILKL